MYNQFNDIEEQHWWFVARRLIVEKITSRYISASRVVDVLDAGCGTGGNLEMIKEFGAHIYAMEKEAWAAEMATKKSGIAVSKGSLPHEVPFSPLSFDLIFLLDVLEHVENDQDALKVLYSLLRPGGHLVITVPAFSFLWSYHDEYNHHHRRYRLPDLMHKVNAAGFSVRYRSYFNFFLFPLIMLLRYWNEITGMRENDLKLPAPIWNRLLTSLMTKEADLMQRYSLPFGVSALFVAQKDSE
ncbi:2-polyprenyl-3-methyl-5-hydroxy-6-metoxy-1,4-benzoquinol methylase [Heliophilum fasciatum]|uniref:2-polyprenyl-3-methyl-5-hydroxy-6-metoxy-1, 4-benzoquinol methylase n=2 Tax=Heliophilum fasciatum TaxID=35700 RepID=A0A4R2RS98_9FIRM|nr:2-polyprenyl-3-methyl-5-hydroxy-6-metoxy-1,4-benzoquinol methylase [Heliophilum fasciatum]